MEQPSRDSSAPVSCPKCQTVNPAVAKFCSTCGAPLQERQQAPPPPLPPHNPFSGTQFGRGRFGGTMDTQATVNLDAATTFQHAVQAIQSAGGQIHWQSPPQSAQFTIRKKESGMEVGFHGDLSVSQLAPQQSMVRADVRVNWSTTVPILISGVVTVIVVIIFGNLFFPFIFVYFYPFIMLLALLTAAYSAWQLGSKLPRDIAEEILGKLQSASAAAAPRTAGWFGLGAFKRQDSAGFPAQAGSPEPPPRAEQTPNVFDQIKQLAELRDAEAITAEEFESKKAELLKRL